MAATNVLQYQGYNTWKLSPGGRVQSPSFFIGDLLTVSFQAYSGSSLGAANRIKVRYIGENGITLSTWTSSFSIPAGNFTRITYEGLTPPSNAEMASIEWSAGAGETWYLNQPKAEHSSVATAFTSNYEGQMSRMTATGLYTGTVTAEQVMLTGGQNVGQRFTTINSNLLTINNNIDVTQSDVASLSAKALTLESKVNTNTSSITNIKAGQITLSSNTTGSLAGMQLSSTSLTLRATGAYFRISTSASDGYFIYAGSSSSSSDRRFLLDSQGRITASEVSISGNITATSGSFTGTINATSGNFSGRVTANSLSVLSGSLSGVTGTLNGVTGSFNGNTGGYLNYPTGYIGLSGSRVGGYFSGTTSGYISSASGYLGSTSYTSYGTSGIQFGGGLAINGITNSGSLGMSYSDIFCRNITYDKLIRRSDERLKQKITKPPFDFAELIYTLPVIDYEYEKLPNKRQLGVIAQTIIKDYPRWVGQRLVHANEENEYLSVDYENLYMASILAIQDLNKRLQALETEVIE